MKRVSEWITLLAVAASIIFIGVLLPSTPVGAIPTHSQSFAEDQEGYYPTPPQDQSECESRGGSWFGNKHCHGNWEGKDKWNEFIKNELNITDIKSCKDAKGTAIRDSSGPLGLGQTYNHCVNFENYNKYVQVARNIPLDPDNEDTPPRTDDPRSILETDEEGGDVARECNVGATGWFICPLTNMMAGAVDSLYEMLVNFVRIPPIITTGENAQIYETWVIFRNFANIVFVLLLLVAIISQISNLGMSNYGIKRLLPRVIVAAVLVNISIYLCILAVDISNIIGQSIYELLKSVSGTVDINITGENGEIAWTNVVATILSGGTIGSIAMISTGAGAIGTFGSIILPIALMALMAALTAFVILALRYLLIYLLIAVSPIAFVLYLLPNTAKYFDKWKDIFITILFFYPLFSVLFGAADLVSRMAISSASDPEVGALGPVMLLFGLFIQVAPLVMSYKLLQTANSVAGTVTNGLQRRGDGFISAAKNRRNKAVGGAMKGSLNRMQNYGAEKGPKSRHPAAIAGRMVTGHKVRKGKTEDRRNAWNSMAERNFLDARGNNEDANQTNFDARAAEMSVSEINTLQKSKFIEALGTTSNKLDANGNPVYELDENKNPTKQIVQEPSRYAVIASGNDATAIESITRQAQAQQLAEERKTYTAEFSGSTAGQLAAALKQAIASEKNSKAQALQSLLYGAGSSGITEAHKVILEEQRKGSEAKTEILEGMRRNLLSNHGDVKPKDLAQMEWAVHGRNIDDVVSRPDFGAGLSDKDKASQTANNMRAMHKQGNLPMSTAKDILSNDNIRPTLGAEQKYILDEIAAGNAAPSEKQWEQEAERRRAQAQ